MSNCKNYKKIFYLRINIIIINNLNRSILYGWHLNKEDIYSISVKYYIMFYEYLLLHCIYCLKFKKTVYCFYKETTEMTIFISLVSLYFNIVDYITPYNVLYPSYLINLF